MLKRILIISLGILTILISILYIKLNSSEERKIEASLKKYYSEHSIEEKEEFKIKCIKKLDDKYLVLSEPPVQEGQSYSDFFVLDEKQKIIAYTSGYKPISPGFSVNIVNYNENKIVFGSINKTRWIDINSSEKIPINATNIKIDLDDGSYINEENIQNNSYIAILNLDSNIQNITLLNENGDIQDQLTNYSKDRNFINYRNLEIK